MSKRDFVLSLLAGIFIGLLSIPISKNLELPSQLGLLFSFGYLFFPIATLIGLLVAYIIGGKLPIIFQIAKFAVIGGLNTFIDFAVLNILINLTSVFSGLGYSTFKGISFSLAVINSYFWNKNWTFGSKTNNEGKELLKFFIISFAGLTINILTASFVVNVVGPQWGVSKVLWANFGGVIATLISLVWNFLGYKLIVFKRT